MRLVLKLAFSIASLDVSSSETADDRVAFLGNLGLDGEEVPAALLLLPAALDLLLDLAVSAVLLVT